MIDYKMIR